VLPVARGRRVRWSWHLNHDNTAVGPDAPVGDAASAEEAQVNSQEERLIVDRASLSVIDGE